MRLHAVLLLGTSLLLAFPMSARAETCGEAFEALALEPTEPTLAAYSVLDVLLLAKDLDKPLPSPVTGEPFVADAWARATESASRELVDRLAACEWNGTLPRLDASTENLLFGRFGDLAPITLVGHPTGAGGTPDVLGVKGGFPAQQPLQFGASQLVAGGKPGIAATAVFVPFLATRGSTGPPGSLGIRRWLAHSGVTATVLLQFESDPPSGRVGSVEIGVGSTTASSPVDQYHELRWAMGTDAELYRRAAVMAAASLLDAVRTHARYHREVLGSERREATSYPEQGGDLGPSPGSLAASPGQEALEPSSYRSIVTEATRHARQEYATLVEAELRERYVEPFVRPQPVVFSGTVRARVSPDATFLPDFDSLVEVEGTGDVSLLSPRRGRLRGGGSLSLGIGYSGYPTQAGPDGAPGWLLLGDALDAAAVGACERCHALAFDGALSFDLRLRAGSKNAESRLLGTFEATVSTRSNAAERPESAVGGTVSLEVPIAPFVALLASGGLRCRPDLEGSSPETRPCSFTGGVSFSGGVPITVK